MFHFRKLLLCKQYRYQQGLDHHQEGGTSQSCSSGRFLYLRHFSTTYLEKAYLGREIYHGIEALESRFRQRFHHNFECKGSTQDLSSTAASKDLI